MRGQLLLMNFLCQIITSDEAFILKMITLCNVLLGDNAVCDVFAVFSCYSHGAQRVSAKCQWKIQ